MSRQFSPKFAIAGSTPPTLPFSYPSEAGPAVSHDAESRSHTIASASMHIVAMVNRLNGFVPGNPADQR